MKKLPTFTYHYFLDEAGDATFYGKGRVPIIGQEGVSCTFILGLLKLHEPLDAARKKVILLQEKIANEIINEWSSKISSLLGLIDNTCHLINRENMIYKL